MKKKIKFSLLIILIQFLPNPLIAQINFMEIPFTPFEGVRESSVAFADVDNDGDQDVLIIGSAISGLTAKLYLNTIFGFNEVFGTPFIGVDRGKVSFADIDGDGDQDVLITGGSGSVRISKLYNNDGNGTFTEALGTSLLGVGDSSSDFADIDGDGDLDLLIAGFDSTLTPISTLYSNNGVGIFTKIFGTPFIGVGISSVAFADVDSDGDQDVMLSGWTGSGLLMSKLYANAGNGTFSEVVGTPFLGTEYGTIDFADVDGDNDLDVLVTGDTSTVANLLSITKLYGNNGNGVFTEMTGSSFFDVASSDVEFVDVDGDNDLDVLITGGSMVSGIVAKLYSNDGNGLFTEVAGTPFGFVIEGAVAFADVDGDGDKDVLITGAPNNWATPSQYIAKLYENNTIPLGVAKSTFDDQITLYPNPTKEGVTINLSKISINVHISITNIIGKEIYSINKNVAKHIKLPLDNLSKGVYYVHITNKDYQDSIKLIKQ